MRANDIRERILELRKTLKLKQLEFAERLGIKQSNLSNIETGYSGISDANIRLICITFNVNEAWLRSGEGPVFVNSAPGSPDETELLALFRKLSPATKKAILNHIKALLEAQNTPNPVSGA
jgi:transcriptional regulator with XRE-family HTH domain